MFGPPSSPPLSRATSARTATAGLLPAFAPQSSSPKSAREFVHPKFTIYQDPEPQGFLPTPIPTSEANAPASSSPPASPAHQAYKAVSPPQVKPLQPLIIVRVPLSGSPVTLGRSSKSSTFAVSARNRLASRVHARLSLSEENFLVIECLGWNGLTVSVPQESGQRQEYAVNYDQILNVERMDGVMVEVHGDKAVVEFDNDAEETEEETWKHYEEDIEEQTEQHLPPTKKRQLEMTPLQTEPWSDTEMKNHTAAFSEERTAPTVGERKNDESLQISQTEETTYQATNGEIRTASNLVNLGSPLAVPATIPLEIPRPGNQANSSDPATHATAPVAADPLPVQANKISAATAPVGSIETEGSTSSATTPAPVPTVKEQTPEPTTKSVRPADTPSTTSEKRKRRQPLSDETRKELENVAVNFIAFSRLSAVPLATVRKASTQLQGLPKSQVRELIRAVKCIGVTDAEPDDTGRLPDDEYYYIPEFDDDESRRTIVRTTSGHRSLRSCRKTRKQYFYRPLNLTE